VAAGPHRDITGLQICTIPVGAALAGDGLQASVEQALARNALRRLDHQVPRASIESVAAAFEPPGSHEGFVEVIEVEAGQSGQAQV
jgi:hypothetical protein